jgi:16S rRNA processing protein RimM
MNSLADPVLMAVIGAPHGVRGQVRVKSFTSEPMALGDYGTLFAQDGRRFTLRELRPSKTVVIARFEEIADRNAAEAVNGLELFVDRSALPDDLEEDEFYQADLIGLEVRDETGEAIGRVAAIHDFGGGDIIEIKGVRGPGVMVPFTRAAIPGIDMAQGFISVDRQAAGLVDDQDASRDAQDG